MHLEVKVDWNFDGVQKGVTLIAAVVAAVASGANLWFKYREKSDKIKVASGLIYPQIEPGYFLNVISLSDHPMQLADYGYILRRGRLRSLPYLDVNEPDYDARTTIGTAFLESRNASFETGVTLRDPPVGVYAITTGQSRPTLAFRPDTPGWMCIWLRLRIWIKVGYD
jgi:hypothetical protein